MPRVTKRNHVLPPFDIERTLEEMRAIRLESKLTQEGLADLVGVPREYISKWENADGPKPSYENLVILHRVLNGLRLELELAEVVDA